MACGGVEAIGLPRGSFAERACSHAVWCGEDHREPRNAFTGDRFLDKTGTTSNSELGCVAFTWAMVNIEHNEVPRAAVESQEVGRDRSVAQAQMRVRRPP